VAQDRAADEAAVPGDVRGRGAIELSYWHDEIPSELAVT
jgi:hypothetical protein